MKLSNLQKKDVNISTCKKRDLSGKLMLIKPQLNYFFKLIAICGILIASSLKTNAQIDSLIVEEYYISDANDVSFVFPPLIDATLEEGSTTYRIYIDLSEGSKLVGIYGTADHPISIKSTENFFNFPLFGTSLGYKYNDQFLRFGTIALDTWLTIGYATQSKVGILKIEDGDGSIIGGANSLNKLNNNATSDGLPLTTHDGYSIPATINSSFVDHGIAEILNPVFGQETKGKDFNSTNFLLQNVSGVLGDPVHNRILIGQFTTKGDLEFELNVIVFDKDNKKLRYVATNENLDSEKKEYYSKFLSYPPKCGCTDPYFVEFDPEAICDDGSCQDSIRFGCSDPLACNYDPNVNWNIEQLCCYGADDCDNRDITKVCPDYEVPELQAIDYSGELKSIDQDTFINISPNPVYNLLLVEFNKTPEKLEIYNTYGDLVLEVRLDTEESTFNHTLRLYNLKPGFYILRSYIYDQVFTKKFIKQ